MKKKFAKVVAFIGVLIICLFLFSSVFKTGGLFDLGKKTGSNIVNRVWNQITGEGNLVTNELDGDSETMGDVLE